MRRPVDVSPERLREIARRIVAAGGSREEEARIVAEHLVLANLSGHDSHGVGMLPAYARNLKAELLVPNRALETVTDDGSILVFEGAAATARSWGARRCASRSSEHGRAECCS